IQAAKSLSSRYNPKVGLIRSWDFGKWQYPVIIDGMMNLELLFRATQESGDSTYYKIALSHARKTLKSHYRPDYSTYHVVDFDSLTGEIIHQGTHQGYHDTSTWARGQSWGLYGWTMMFRETGDSVFLRQANQVADHLLNHANLPADGIPYWDYDAPNIPDAPRDVSSATIMASALVELSSYVDADRKSRYLEAVFRILNTLNQPAYKARSGANGGLLFYHSVAHLPENAEVDVGIIYADYYWLETMIRLRRLPDMKSFGTPPDPAPGVASL
ncbi:MAG: glucuronyl hydrolase, partial [Bacteroidota bacterium]